MQSCPSCGNELTGPYCNMCGAKAPGEEKKKVRKEPDAEVPKAAPRVHARPQPAKRQSLTAPNRIWKVTAQALLALALFGGGMVTGFWMASDAKAGDGPLTSTTVDATEQNLPAVALGSKYMDEGVDFLTKNERAAAGSAFRKAISYFEKAIAEDANDLYAHTYLGLTYYYAGDATKAIETERAVLQKDPNYLWAIFNLAWIYETGAKKNDAVLMYKKYLAVVEEERKNPLKYIEQQELIDRQVEASKKALEKLGGAN